MLEEKNSAFDEVWKHRTWISKSDILESEIQLLESRVTKLSSENSKLRICVFSVLGIQIATIISIILLHI